jgi:hypothetical protein
MERYGEGGREKERGREEKKRIEKEMMNEALCFLLAPWLGIVEELWASVAQINQWREGEKRKEKEKKRIEKEMMNEALCFPLAPWLGGSALLHRRGTLGPYGPN